MLCVPGVRASRTPGSYGRIQSLRKCCDVWSIFFKRSYRNFPPLRRADMINDWLGILLKNFNVLPRDGKVWLLICYSFLRPLSLFFQHTPGVHR
jgi:hypothetical protein